jgi:hypothetical protein
VFFPPRPPPAQAGGRRADFDVTYKTDACPVHAKVVQERLGHLQISVTLDTCSHILPSMQLETASRLNQVLQPSQRRRKAKQHGWLGVYEGATGAGEAFLINE